MVKISELESMIKNINRFLKTGELRLQIVAQGKNIIYANKNDSNGVLLYCGTSGEVWIYLSGIQKGFELKI